MIDEKKKKKKNKKPSAMAQVHNRVNAGIMDAVTCGGMCEGAEPEDEEYKIGAEDEGGPSDYWHVIDESTDCVKFGDYYFDCYLSNAIAFMSLKRKDGSSGPIFVAKGNLHGNLKAWIVSQENFSCEEYGRPSELVIDGTRTGRFWKGKDCNVISFYSYDSDPKQIYKKCIDSLYKIEEKIGKEFNFGEVMVDLWTKSSSKPVIMPVRWFNNGTAEVYLPYIKSCEPEMDFTGDFNFKLETTKGKFVLDWRGDDVEKPAYSLGEHKTMYITENQAHMLRLLLENEGTNMKKARNFLRDKGYDEEQRQKILNAIRTDIPNTRLQQCKFILGAVRLYLDGELSDGNSIFEFNKALKYIASDAHEKEYDYNLNGESLETLVNRFSGVARADLQANIDASNQRQYSENREYKIVPIDTPEEAQKYGKYTTWCVTHDEDMYNSYTHEGTGRFYFCLRNGFQQEKKVRGENCPLDSYGLSMIAVSVDSEGAANTITCRWNHDNGGNDNIMDPEELENLLGRNFYQTFKPYTEEELLKKGFLSLKIIKEKLESGTDPHEFETFNGVNIIDSAGRVCIMWVFDKCYYLIQEGDKYRLLFDKAAEASEPFNHGWSIVGMYYNGRKNPWEYNFVNEQGGLASETWFSYCTGFEKGYSKVALNGKWNLFGHDGSFYFDKWIDWCPSPYECGFFVVTDDKRNYIKYNFIGKDGELISDTWFDSVYPPDKYRHAGVEFEGLSKYARVYIAGTGYNLMDIEGNLFSDKWYHAMYADDLGKVAIVRDDNGMYNFLDRNANLILPQWAERITNFQSTSANGGYPNDNDVAKLFIDSGQRRRYEWGTIENSDKQNLIRRDGKVVSDVWFDYISTPNEYARGRASTIAEVLFDGGWNILDIETGKILLDKGVYGIVDAEDTGDGGLRIRVVDEKGDTESRSVYIPGNKKPEPALATINESVSNDFNYKKYIKSFIDFLDGQHLKIRPLPEIELKDDEQDGLFIKTGYYDPTEKVVVAYINERHPKDVMRTIAHEFVHHMQNLENPKKDWGSGGDLEEDSKLRGIEGEAFLLGNILFREWTEKLKRTGELNESRKKIVKNDKGEIVPEKCDKCGGDVVCQIHGEPVYICKDCGRYFGTMPCNLNESINPGKALKNLRKRMDPAHIDKRFELDEIAEIVEPDDVDLSSFNIKKHLNPKFWDDGHLDTRIRLKLLDIADDFFDSLGVDWVEPEDVIMTGSLANYNWNDKYSDIDLHVLVDYEDVDERIDFVREYFTMKKNEWNEKHKNLKIFGFPVEVYVQDSNEPHASSGIYSVDKDKWLTEPDLENLRSGKVDKKRIRKMIATYMNKIDCLIDIYKKHKDDEYEMKKVAKDASEMLDEIKKLRKDDLGKYKREMCDGNIIFKALRRSDYIGKLLHLKNLTYDKIHSI